MDQPADPRVSIAARRRRAHPEDAVTPHGAGAAQPAAPARPERGDDALSLPAEAAYANDVYLLAPVGYFVLGFDTTILQMNVVGADLLGLQRGHAAPVHFRSFVSPRFHDDFDRFLRQAINSGQPEQCNLQMAHSRQQQGFPVTLRASADASGQALRLVLEPAEGKLAALERNEERFRRIIHSAEEGIWEIDAHARTSFVNPKMARMLGYTIEQMLDQPLVAFMDDEGRALLERNIARRQPGMAQRHEFKFLRRDGGALWVTLATNPIFDAGGAYLGALALVGDGAARAVPQQQAWRLASFDAPTGLPNRLMLDDRLGQELKKARREGSLLGLLLISVDGAHEDGAPNGADIGSGLLAQAAQRIGACVRASDTLARHGDEEFSLILPGMDQVTSIERVAQQLIDSLARPFTVERRGMPLLAGVTACIGIALFPDDADDGPGLLRRAGQAMAAARAAGTDTYSHAAPERQLASQARQRLALELRLALEQGQFELYYQPVAGLRDGAAGRAQALLRWHHPQRGLLAPAEFLPCAGTAGLMPAIGDWVFRQAAAQARLWQAQLGPDFCIVIPLWPPQLRGDGTLYQGWLKYAAELGMAPGTIVLEVAQHMLLDGMDGEVALGALRPLGLQVALDGAGPASLAPLHRFDIDVVKLDRAMVRALQPGSVELALCEAIAVMARKLGWRLAADGVETAQQAALLAAAGCDWGQGSLFAAPLPAPGFLQAAREARGRFSSGAGPATPPPARG